MTLYVNNKPVLHKFYSNESFLFFKVYTKQEYFKYLDSRFITYHSYDNNIDFPYNIKKVNNIESKEHYLMESYPDFVYDNKESKNFYGFEIRKYLVEESYLKHGNKGLTIQTREHIAIELLIGSQIFVCFEQDLKKLS